jgi:pimeloyl-ACP methyl ester carboxylesterase
MVKKTLLSLAIAASTAGLTACNISSTADNNEVATNPVTAGTTGNLGLTAPVFSAARLELPAKIDLLFAAAATTDGTASVTDTSFVTSMINDLAGFSATASIDIVFNAALNPASVVAGSSVWLVELKSKEDNSLIDALDLASIVAASPSNPFAEGADQLSPGVDYTAEYVEMDGGATPSIRIHPLKPLDPKTKYIVVVTDKLKDTNGNTVVPSPEYDHLSGNQDIINPALAPVRAAIQGWEKLAGGFLAVATQATQTQDNVILSYAFTTEANDDILLAMAAPENYISGLLNDTKTLEGLLGEDAVTALVQGIGTALSMPFATDSEIVAVRNTATYKATVTSKVAQSIIGGGAAQTAGVALAGGNPDLSPAQVNGAFAAWNGTAGNEAKQIPADPADWTAVHYDYIARALGQYSDTTTTEQYILAASNGAGELLKDAAHRPSAQDFVPIRTDVNGNSSIAASEIIPVPNSALGLPTATISVQGMLTLPQFMKVNDFSDTDSFSDFWKGSRSVGAVIDQAFGNPTTTTPPQDTDGSLNVTYRFPFAQHIEDVKVPVLVTYPTPGAGCVKPDDGWPTVIFQHGITTDRTASLGFANSMAATTAGCFATVAMDLPTHGIDSSSTDRNGAATRYAPFNGFNVAGYVDTETPANTPFAAALAGLAALNVTTYAGLEERHGNIALNAQQQPTPMVFTPGSESGNSGDFFINLTNMQQTRDHIRQGVMDLLNLNASLENIGDAINVDLNGDETADLIGQLDTDNVYFVGHSLGAITGLTYAAVNNAIANNAGIVTKEINPLKAVVFANPGGQLPKLLENSPSFSARILPGLAAAGLTQGMSDLEKFFDIFQAPLDSADPVNFTDLLKETGTPVLMFEMVGGGLVNATDSNTDAMAGKVTGLPDTLIGAGGYPADTVVPNNANPALNDVTTGLSYLTGTDPLVRQLGLTTVTASIAPSTDNLMLVSKLKEGTHGTISSADAYTVFAEMIGQTASFFQTAGKGLVVGDADQLQAAE